MEGDFLLGWQNQSTNTMIMGKQENEVVIKFHKQASELHLKNISTKESNCLLNGGRLNCVLATAY